ncbi:ABC transporter ATP-binding protein [Shewanella youngdeokensis]|uniref:ABC transporter ATP-binding protein n=1 Tax=Shewanella youngdeokensis TaxID=2999068 RepID=A0ABZ0K2I4_9GAMM|nr:ABC transporter ATP-binding protein [Shewanella sp. DAU334]
MQINIKNVSYYFRTNKVLDGVDLQLPAKAKVGLLGPNGCGKTTLLKLLCGLIKPSAGSISLNHTPLSHHNRQQLSATVGLMMQHAPAALDLTVAQVVALGRIRHRCQQTLTDVLQQNSLNDVAQMSYNQLSGGERQRVMFAQLHYQQPQLMLLDEPANHLDINHCYQILNKVSRLQNTSIASYHCFNLAAVFCDYLVLMQHGKIIVSGKVEQVLQPHWLKQAYGIDVEILRNSQGTPIVSVKNQ